MQITNNYEKVLTKYCKDDGLRELIELCIIDDFGRREAFYKTYGRYPEQQNLIMKLKDDLMAREMELIKEGGK